MMQFGNVNSISLDDPEYFEILGGLWTGKKPPFTTAGVIRNTNFTISGEVDYSKIAWLDVEVRQLAKRQLKHGDIIIERSGGGPNQPVGRVVQFRLSNGVFSFSNFTTTVRVKKTDFLEPLFAFYILLELYQSGRTDDIQQRTTGLRNLDFKAYKERAIFPLISLPEQRHIAHILTTVQTAIEQQARMIALTRELKSALMHKLFTEGLRGEKQKESEIGPVPESWEVLPLSEVMDGTPKNGMYKPLEAYGTGTLILRINDFSNDGDIVTSASNRIDADKSELITYALQENDIITNRVNSLSHLGKTALVGVLAEPMLFESNMMKYRVDKTKALPSYIMRLLNSPIGKTQIVGSAKRAVAQSSINQGDLGAILLPIPKIEIQEDIVGIIDNVVAKIEVHIRKKILLEELFRTLLHQLMTGQMRVNELDLPGLLPNEGAVQ